MLKTSSFIDSSAMNANVVVFKRDKKPRVQLIVRTYVRGKMSKINKGRKKQNKINVKRGKTINGREVPGDRYDN